MFSTLLQLEHVEFVRCIVNNSLYAIAQILDDPSFQEQEDQEARARQITEVVDLAAIQKLRERTNQFLATGAPYDGLSFYYQLESSTPLMAFHTILRKGCRNRYRNGLQQTYGDHTRLLLLGIDMMEQGNLDWYLSRRAEPFDLGLSEIQEMLTAYRSIGLNREHLLALWTAASLHDYGKLYRRGFGLDAEDAIPLCRSVVENLVDPLDQPLIEFAIRNHDLIEYVLTGETPESFIERQVRNLPPSVQPLGLACLGIIQAAGACSLGEGRLTLRKLRIFHQCVSGAIISDTNPVARLSRLLSGEQLLVGPALKEMTEGLLTDLATQERADLVEFLESVILHGWTEYLDTLAATTPPEQMTVKALRTLLELAGLWRRDFSDCEHMVLDEPSGSTGQNQLVDLNSITLQDSLKSWSAASILLLNSSRAVIISC